MRRAGLDDGEPANASPGYPVAQGSMANLSAQGRDALFKEFVDYQEREPHREANRAGSLDLQQRDSLFREFAEYQKQQSRAASIEQPVPKHFAELIANQKQ